MKSRPARRRSTRWAEVGAFLLCAAFGSLGAYGALTARAELRARGGEFRTERFLHRRRSPERRLVKGIAYGAMGTIGAVAYVALWVYDGSRWLRRGLTRSSTTAFVKRRA